MIQKNEIFKRYGDDPVSMTRTLLSRAELAALIGDTGRRIGIKPNLVCPTPASYGATTHPEIVEGILIYLRENGFNNLVILEGSWVGDRTSDAYEYCGYRDLCERYGVPFVDTQKDGSHNRDCDGMELAICDAVDDVDYLINVPVLKGHCQTRITCALKNLKGLIPNSEKRKFHTMGLHKPIAHLSRGIRQDFIVIDHICGDPDFEEGGNPVKMDCVMVARDPVLVDSYVCRLLGYELDAVPYIGMAERLGSGSSDLTQSNIHVLNEEGEVVRSFNGAEDDPYEAGFRSGRRVLDVSVDVDDWDSCSACFGNFTAALYRLREEGLWDEKKVPHLSIGQGHRNKRGTLGIGNCCRLFDSFIPGCPPREEEIYTFLKELLH